MNIHHANQADTLNSSVESLSNRIIYLKKDNGKKLRQVRRVLSNKYKVFQTLEIHTKGDTRVAFNVFLLIVYID